MQALENDLNIELGYCYDGGRGHENPRDSKGRPGTRAPHVWLERNGEKISTLDLFVGQFVLLAGPEGNAWREGAGRGIDLVQIGAGGISDPENGFCNAFGITPSGAVLVRPDGFAGCRWEACPAAPAEAMSRALDGLLFRQAAQLGT
jgi:putative polyketide hydroxylase